MDKHVCTHPWMHALTNTHTHTHTQTHTDMHQCTHACTHTYTPTPPTPKQTKTKQQQQQQQQWLWRFVTNLVENHHDLDLFEEELIEGLIKGCHAISDHPLQLAQLCLQLLWHTHRHCTITHLSPSIHLQLSQMSPVAVAHTHTHRHCIITHLPPLTHLHGIIHGITTPITINTPVCVNPSDHTPIMANTHAWNMMIKTHKLEYSTC